MFSDLMEEVHEREANKAFNNGLLLGIEALQRAAIHLATNQQLIEPYTHETLITWMRNDLMSLRERLKSTGDGPIIKRIKNGH